MSNAGSSKRHPENRNLVLHEGPEFHGMPVQQQKAPLIENYLDRIEKVIQTSLLRHPRVAAMRFDLRLPQEMQAAGDDNRLMTAFWERLKDRIEHDRARARKQLGMAHDTTVGYIWAREYDHPGNRPHWHCVLLVNKDAYFGIGRLWSDQENMHKRITSAWNSALGITPEQGQGLAEAPKNPVYHLHRHSGGRDFTNLFYRLSYFTKMKTKQYHGSAHAFGGSSVTLV